MRIKVDVALTPGLAGETEGKICVVVDVLRASSTLAVMFDRGITDVVIAGSVSEALGLKAWLGDDYLLCGEVGGLPPDGFDYGNSPTEFAQLNLDGRRAILATTNGSKLLAELHDAAEVYVGSILNASAVAQSVASASLVSARDITIICSGESGGTAFSLEDAIGAGAIASQLADRDDVEMLDGASAAIAIYRSAEADIANALGITEHGRDLARLGLTTDLEFCARLNSSSAVPRLHKSEAGYTVLRAE